MAETNLRQANAKAFVHGVVSEKDLKVVTEEGKNKITGHLTVKTSDVNFIKFNVNVNEKTKNNTDNKTYAGIQTVMNEYKSIAEVGVYNLKYDDFHLSCDVIKAGRYTTKKLAYLWR